MTAPKSRLFARHLLRGRGRVYRVNDHWFADYRTAKGLLLSAWADSHEEALDWIRRFAS